MENSSQISRIAVIVKWNQPAAMETGRSLVQWLEGRGCRVCFFENAEPGVNGFVGGTDCLPEVDLVVVMGGDGTFLSAARRTKQKVPILGVNIGGMGFLTEFSIGDLHGIMDRILEGNYETERRSVLHASVVRDEAQIIEYSALNDIVINKAALARMIRLIIYVEGDFLNALRADGLIVSSPTGSTAYNLSAGGPIIHPALECFILTPICPFMLTNRPIILPDSSEIDIRIDSKAMDVTLTFDGQLGFDLRPGDRVRVRKAQNGLTLIRSPWTNYFEILRTKLKWGGEQ